MGSVFALLDFWSDSNFYWKWKFQAGNYILVLCGDKLNSSIFYFKGDEEAKASQRDQMIIHV